MECDQLITALGDDPAEFEHRIMKAVNKEAIEYITVHDEIENKPQVVGVQVGPHFRMWGAAAGVALKSAPAAKKMTSSTFSNPHRPINASIPCTMPPTRAGIALYAALQQESMNANINTAHIEEIRRVLAKAVLEKDKSASTARDEQIKNFCAFVKSGRGLSDAGLSIDRINQALKDHGLDDCVRLDYNSTCMFIPQRELLEQVAAPQPLSQDSNNNNLGRK
jgi:hypothetical protein